MGSKITEYIIVGLVVVLVAVGYFYNKNKQSEVLQLQADQQQDCGTPQAVPLSPEVEKYIAAQLDATSGAGGDLARLLSRVIELEKQVETFQEVQRNRRDVDKERAEFDTERASAFGKIQERLVTMREAESDRLRFRVINTCKDEAVRLRDSQRPAPVKSSKTVKRPSTPQKVDPAIDGEKK